MRAAVPRAPLDPQLSATLDLLRWLAALVVLLSHVWPLLLPALPLPWPGHAAVVLFFVLSGFLIAHAADRPGLTLAAFGAHRAIRIGSVAYPAIVLAIAIAPVAGGERVVDGGPMLWSPAAFWQAVTVNLVFLGQSWQSPVSPPYISPYWSLCYEVWYYAIFACWHWGARRRWLAVALCAAVAGPRILLLMPVWLCGVLAYRWRGRLSLASARALAPASALFAFAVFWTDAPGLLRARCMAWFPAWTASLYASNQFAGDIVLGLLTGLFFIALTTLAPRWTMSPRLRHALAWPARYTLSVYLYHMPLSILLWNGMGLRAPLLYVPALALGIAALAQVTECRHGQLRRRFDRWYLGAATGAARASG